MNQVVAATVIISAIFLLAIFGNTLLTSTIITGNEATNQDINVIQESISAKVSGNDLIIVNDGKDTSEILKYRFYSNSNVLLEEINAQSIGGDSIYLSQDNSTLDRRNTRILDMNDIWPPDATTGEVITSYGNVFPIEYDITCIPFKIQNKTFACDAREFKLEGNKTIPVKPPSFSVGNGNVTTKTRVPGADISVVPDNGQCKLVVNNKVMDTNNRNININGVQVDITGCNIKLAGEGSGGGSGGGDYTADDRVIGAGVAAGMSSTGKFVNHQLSGRIFEGDSTLLGEQHANVPAQGTADTIWVSYVGDGDKKISNNIVLDYTPYVYNKNSETLSKSYTSGSSSRASSFDMNAVSYKQGSPSIHHHQPQGSFPEWIKYKSSSPSLTIMKLPDHLKGQSIIFHTFLERGMSVEVINSVVPNLQEKQFNSDNVVLFESSTSNTIKHQGWYKSVSHSNFLQKRNTFNLYTNMPTINVGGILTSSLNNIQTTGNAINVIINSERIGDHFKINSISSSCKEEFKQIYPRRNTQQGWWFNDVSQYSAIAENRYGNWYYPITDMNKHTSGWNHVKITYGTPKYYYYCAYTTLNVNIHDPSPYNSLSLFENKRECINYEWAYLGGGGPLRNCVQYSNANESIHKQSNIQSPSDGTNYLIIRYDGDTSIGNADTLLDEDHIFAEINKQYRSSSDTTKKLINGVAESNIFLMPHDPNNALLDVSNLPPNIPYEIKQSGNILVTGFTSADGKIELNTSQLRASGSGTITLILYPNSGVYQGTIIQDDTNAITYDPRNKYFINMNGVDNQIYVAQGYIRYTISSAVDIGNVTLHKGDKTVSLDGLNRHYEAGTKMYVPILPGYLTITMDINGVYAKFYMHDLLEGAYANNIIGESRIGESRTLNPAITDLSGLLISTKDKTAVTLNFDIATFAKVNGKSETESLTCPTSFRIGGTQYQVMQSRHMRQSFDQRDIGGVSHINQPGLLTYTISYQINGETITSLPPQIISFRENTRSNADSKSIQFSGGTFTMHKTFAVNHNSIKSIQYTFNIPNIAISDQIRVIIDLQYQPGYSFILNTITSCYWTIDNYGYRSFAYGPSVTFNNFDKIGQHAMVNIQNLQLTESIFNNLKPIKIEPANPNPRTNPIPNFQCGGTCTINMWNHMIGYPEKPYKFYMD